MIVSECEGRQTFTLVGAIVGAAAGGAATAPLGAAPAGPAAPPLPTAGPGPLGAAGCPHASSSAPHAIVATRRHHIGPSYPRPGFVPPSSARPRAPCRSVAHYSYR